MTRYGAMYGPDYTFLGVPACDLDDASTWESAQVVVLGAPYDGGTSHRAGARFGPRAIRAACRGRDGPARQPRRPRGAQRMARRRAVERGELPPFDPGQPLLDGR